MNSNELLAYCDIKTNMSSEYYNNRMTISNNIMLNAKEPIREVILSPKHTLDWVCNKLETTKEIVLGSGKKKPVRVKSIVSVLLSKQNGYTLREIKDVVRVNNHATVLNYFINMDVDNIKYNKELYSDWKYIQKLLCISWDFTYKNNRAWK